MPYHGPNLLVYFMPSSDRLSEPLINRNIKRLFQEQSDKK